MTFLFEGTFIDEISFSVLNVKTRFHLSRGEPLKKIKISLILAGMIGSVGLLKGQSLASTDPQAQIKEVPPSGGPELKVDTYLREPRFWVTPEYVHYWENAAPALPDLVDLSSAGGATIGQVYDQHRVTFSNGNAVRLTLGGWIDPNEKIGVELSGFYTPKQSQTDSFTGTPTGPIIAAPFFNVGSTSPTQRFFGGIGTTQGSASFISSTESYGGEGDVLLHHFTTTLGDKLSLKVDELGGFRYFGVADQFQENVGRQNSGNDFSATDNYQTQNNFYGVNLGAHVRARYEGFFAELTPKIGVGVTNESVDVSGSFSSPSPNINPGGFLAIGNKLGDRGADKFAVLPQVTLKVGYDFSNRVEIFAGYDLLYLSQVARANGQITNLVDKADSPTANFGGVAGAPDTSPQPSVTSTSFFEQGVTGGLTVKF
jgi:hypothetical protein